MLNWLKRTFLPGPPELPPEIKEIIRPTALASAVAQVLGEYHKDIKAGKKTYPAYKRPFGAGPVVEIWADTRLEALSNMWEHGASSLFLLAEHKRQEELLEAMFEKKPHLEFPHQPTGDLIHDSLQGVFQVYRFLGKAGDHVLDEATSRHYLKKEGKNIFSDFEVAAEQLRTDLRAFLSAIRTSGPRPPIPKTVFDILYRDVTRKAKTIAFTAQFGPDYRGNMKAVLAGSRTTMLKEGRTEASIEKELAPARALFDKVLAADDPDHVLSG